MAEEEQAEELRQWMAKLKLTAYVAEAEAWRQETGCASVEEIRENQAEFAVHLKLKKLEIRRIEKFFEESSGGGGYPTGSTSNRSPVVPKATGAPLSDLPPGWTHKIGTAPNDYAMYKELGSGATAKVYECRKLSSPSEAVAVKAIDLRALRMQKDYKKLAQVLNREMQILLSLQHPRIVKLHDVFDTDDKLYLVMECLRGGELFDYIIGKGSLTEPGARNVFCQIVEGLRHVHAKDIVYRDLKPENILLVEKCTDEEQLKVKLSDFGHSKLVNDGFSTALTRVGTPQYWAPEVQEAGAAKQGYDKSVDLWSLGVVLYVMLMGAYPFDSARGSVEQQMRNPRLNFRSPVSGREASAPAKDLISSLIKYQPKQRLPLDKCFSHGWTQAQGHLDDGPVHQYCAMDLQRKPTREERDGMVKDLLKFQTKFKCFAQVRRDMVVADLNALSPAQAAEAKQDLKGIIRIIFNFEANERMVDSLTGQSSVDSIPEGTYMTQTTTLRVHEEYGAGLMLAVENGGMKVEGVEPNPGQENIQPNDLIVKIDGHPLVGAPEVVEETFGAHFGDGVQIQIKRWQS